MEIKDVGDDPHLTTMPTTPEESALVQKMFEKATELLPDLKMGDRTDLAMAMLGVVKRWAHENEMTNYRPEEDLGPRAIRSE